MLRQAKDFVFANVDGTKTVTDLRNSWKETRIKQDGDAPALGSAIRDVTSSDPGLVHVKALRAFDIAMAELRGGGFLIEEDYLPRLGSVRLQNGKEIQVNPNFTGGDASRQVLVLSSLSTATMPPSLSEPSQFLADLGPLKLSKQTVRCVHEGLSAFKVGGYMSAVLLMGAATEGTTYAVAKALVLRDPQIKKHLRDRNRDALNTALANYVEGQKSLGGKRKVLARGLQARASYMAEVRNYGAHPASSATEIEEVFSEVGASNEIVATHQWMRNWSEVVSTLVKGRRRLPPPTLGG